MRWLFAIAATLASGCFYLDPINERPSAEIHQLHPEIPIIRGDADPSHQAEVEAVWSDPNSDDVTFAWTVDGCAADGVSCPFPIVTGTTQTLPFTVPAMAGIAKVRVQLDVIDAHGAHARPGQTLLLDVTDRNPTVKLQANGRMWNEHHVITQPITVLVAASDPDNDGVGITWDPPFSAATDPLKSAWTKIDDVNLQRVFTPDVAGQWTLHITADDHQGGTAEDTLVFEVPADQPPCIGNTDPALTTTTIVLDQIRRFSILSVDDDISIYPAPSSNSTLQTAGFTWSIKSPTTNGAFVPLGTEENNVVLDPAQYAPGDTIDLRVDVIDAVARPLPCDPSLAQCSIGGTSCLQRQTWHVEVR